MSGPDLGHLLPILGLGVALRARGHEVRVVSGAVRASAVHAAGLAFTPLPGAPEPVAADDLAHRLWRRPAQLAESLAAVVAEAETDLVVADTLTRVGAFAAELAGCDWVELIPHHLVDPAPDIPPVGLGRRPSRLPWRRLDDARIHRAQLASLRQGRRQEAAARETLGLTGTGTPRLRLLATLPGLEHPRAQWPIDVHIVGPLAAEPAMPVLAPPDGDEPLVVVTDSSVDAIRRSLAADALRGLRHSGVRLAVTTARDDLTAWPGAVVGAAPHGPLLDRATLAVGFGGAGFVGKALARGVPLVLLPLQGDQREAAARVRHAGAGIVLPLRLANATTVRLAVRRVLANPAFAAAADRLARQADELGPAHATRLVEAALANEVPPGPGPVPPSL